MQKDSDTSVRLLSYRDDQPKNGQGLLIPRKRESTKVQQKFDFAVLFTVLHSAGFRVTMGAFAALLLAVVGITGYGLVSQMNLASVPSVTIVDTYNDVVATLEYGPHHAFQNGSLFVETRDSFIDEGVTFVEVNLADQ